MRDIEQLAIFLIDPADLKRQVVEANKTLKELLEISGDVHSYLNMKRSATGRLLIQESEKNRETEILKSLLKNGVNLTTDNIKLAFKTLTDGNIEYCKKVTL